MPSPQTSHSARLRLLFCGTPQFAVPTLQQLLAQPDFEIAAVISQPDRPRGRGNEVAFSAVKEAAISANVPVFQPEKIRTPESERYLRDANADAMVIIAYGQIIPARLLGIPRLGWINAHASLLPRYRGAAPIQWAIANGESVTGVTTMRIDAGTDTGDILLREETAILPDETTPLLASRLAQISATLMADTLRGLRDGTLSAARQDHDKATLAPLLKKEDGRIHWSFPAQTIYNRMRAFTSWPGAYTTFRGTTCQLLGVPVSKPIEVEGASPGALQQIAGDWYVACGQKTLLRLSRVKPEGRHEISGQEFANGAHLQAGDAFV